MNKQALKSLKHIKLELEDLEIIEKKIFRHHIDRYHCHANGFENRNGGPEWKSKKWNISKTTSISEDASKLKTCGLNKKELDTLTTLDHAIPVSTIVELLINKSKEKELAIEEIAHILDKNLFYITVTREENKRLTQRKMPSGYYDVNNELFNDRMSRYKLANIKFINFKD